MTGCLYVIVRIAEEGPSNLADQPVMRRYDEIYIIKSKELQLGPICLMAIQYDTLIQT